MATHNKVLILDTLFNPMLDRSLIFANSLDPDEMMQNAASHQDPNCLPKRPYFAKIKIVISEY